jgi:hypothetical protein
LELAMTVRAGSGEGSGAGQASAFQEIHAQHRDLADLLRALVRDLHGLAERPSAAAEAEALARIDEFERRLRSHFDFEEAGGYLAEELAMAPRLAARASRLLSEHNNLAAGFARFCERAHEAGRIPGGWQTLDAELSAFVERIRLHEHDENELIQEAMMVDDGGG